MKIKINKQTGFTLVEIAIVLVIFGLVMSALLMPLQAQHTRAAQLQTEATLENAKRALLGFAQANGRLPCPATAVDFRANTDAGSRGQENPILGTHNIPANPATANCAAPSGFLPATTLGVQPTDAQGFALDAWNNRLRYAVTAADTSAVACGAGSDSAPDFTTTGNMAAVGLSCLVPNIQICQTAAAANCSNSAATIFSTGPTGGQGSVGRADELENLNGDNVFVSHDIVLSPQANPNEFDPNEFDHIVTWISPFVLYNAMIEAGQLH